MPYVITERYPADGTGERLHIVKDDAPVMLSRAPRAVATLEEARLTAYNAVLPLPHTRADEDAALLDLPEQGGAIGLPDGTVIEVARVEWSMLARSCEPPMSISGPSGCEWADAEKVEIIDAYNAERENA